MTTHCLTIWGQAPGKPDTFWALCWHTSENKAEFSNPTDKKPKPVTCEACLRKVTK